MKVIDTVEMINNGIDQQEVITHNYFGDEHSVVEFIEIQNWCKMYFSFELKNE